jgi:UDP-arabinose 4-epimerase
VLGRAPALKVFGTDYPTADGTAIRDYIHVADLAEAHLLALRRLEKGDHALALNLGTGTGHSVREVIASIEKVSGRKVPRTEVGRRAGDPPSLVAGSEPRAAEPRLDAEVRGARCHRRARVSVAGKAGLAAARFRLAEDKRCEASHAVA